MTISFVSDANVACTGWEAEWSSTVPPPQEPVVTSIAGTCNSNIIDLSFDIPIQCDSVNVNYFVLNSPLGFSILDVQPNPCVADSATDFQIILDNPVDDCETFDFNFEIHIPDQCDSVYIFNYNEVISITDCPLESIPILSTDTICENNCADISADGDGGDCNYIYTWTNGLPLARDPMPFVLLQIQPLD